MAETHIVINKTNDHKNHDDEFLLSPSSSSGSAFDPELQRPGSARSSSSSPSRSSLDLHVIFITAALLFLLLTILALHFAIRCCLRRCFPAHSSSSSGGTQPPPALPIASSRPATLKKKQLDSLPIITFHVIRPHNDEEVHMPPRHHDNQNCSDNSNGGNANANANATEGRGSCRPTEAYEHMSGGDAAVCAICLAEFTAGERLRRLPACGHVFHATCVGTWLASHSASCPICRASPLLDRPSSNYTSSSSSSPPPPLELRILITTPSNPKPLLNPN